ncbi:hypothetical protein J6590_031402 [Homalodisca vitripennis]|nr:hypothetical protein J6590_031402 [Homalodisca vitripennis]
MDTRQLQPARTSLVRTGLFVKSKYTQSNGHPPTATGPAQLSPGSIKGRSGLGRAGLFAIGAVLKTPSIKRSAEVEISTPNNCQPPKKK